MKEDGKSLLSHQLEILTARSRGEVSHELGWRTQQLATVQLWTMYPLQKQFTCLKGNKVPRPTLSLFRSTVKQNGERGKMETTWNWKRETFPIIALVIYHMGFLPFSFRLWNCDMVSQTLSIYLLKQHLDERN